MGIFPNFFFPQFSPSLDRFIKRSCLGTLPKAGEPCHAILMGFSCKSQDLTSFSKLNAHSLTISCQKYWSTLVQELAWCMTVSSHYLKQCWHIMTSKNAFQWNFNPNYKNCFGKMHLKMSSVEWLLSWLIYSVLVYSIRGVNVWVMGSCHSNVMSPPWLYGW